MPRPPLEQAVRDRGFTPSVRDVGPLIELLRDDSLVKDAERAIERVGPPALGALRTAFDQATPPLRARIVRAIGRLASDPGARAMLVAALGDPDPKARSNAAIALGHWPGGGVEDALLRAWGTDTRPEMRRSIAASLGKVGTGASMALLQEASGADDAELARIAGRAAMMVARTASRGDRGTLDPGRVPETPFAVEIFGRRGLEQLLAEELAAAPGVAGVGVAGPGRVLARLEGAPSALFGARTMLAFRFPLPTEWLRAGETAVDGIARAVAGPDAARIFATFTEGTVRYRLAWADGGHKRAASWDAARAIALRAPHLVNDPTASSWELEVSVAPTFVDVAVTPRALEDPRFAWRRRDVPAASHPTIAAALARVAGVAGDDVVWDPFVGAGAELVERALAGPYRALLGTDIEPRALSSARENLDAAGLSASLDRRDALSHAPKGVTLIITNPPMGRRASREPGLPEMLDRFVAHAASVLVRRGRLVWVAPFPKRSRVAAESAGLVLDWAQVVDMGGFDAEIQRWVKPPGTP